MSWKLAPNSLQLTINFATAWFLHACECVELVEYDPRPIDKGFGFRSVPHHEARVKAHNTPCSVCARRETIQEEEAEERDAWEHAYSDWLDRVEEHEELDDLSTLPWFCQQQ